MSLPHNLDAERALLGGVLFNNDYADACVRVQPDHFHDPANARVYSAIRGVLSANALANATTIAARLDGDPAFSEGGGARAYMLRFLAAAAQTERQVAEYAEIVRDTAARRNLILALHAIAGFAERPPEGEGADEIISRATATLASLSDEISRQAGVSVTLRDAWAKVEQSLASPLSPSARTGLASLDRRLGGLFAPDLVVLAGRPAMGKTSLATNIAVNAAAAGGVVHFASLEMSAEQLAGRVGSRLTRAFNYSDLRQPEWRPSPESVAGKEDLFPWSMVIDETGAQTLAHLEGQARATARRFGGLSLIVVDYLQLMRDPSTRKAGRTQEVTELTMGLKTLAKRLNVPVLALSQLSRQVESRDDKRPQLADLRDSGSIEQDADSVLFGYRDEYYLRQREPKHKEGESKSDFDQRFHHWADAVDASAGVMEVIVAKNRHGPPGVETLRFEPPKDTITDDREAPAQGRAA